MEDAVSRIVGFRSIEWLAAQDAPPGADPWLCVVNGRPLFLQGVNWVPIRADYADVTAEEVRARLVAYRDLGVNIVRVWGGAALESEAFYDACDELGILVWQELPLSSSGLDNDPPHDAEFAARARRHREELRGSPRAHHPSLALWGGGNELTAVSAPAVPGLPLDDRHPALGAARAAFADADPGRRFVATSPMGPRFEADQAEFGLGLHHDVHGPWDWPGDLASWQRYWDRRRLGDALRGQGGGGERCASCWLVTDCWARAGRTRRCASCGRTRPGGGCGSSTARRREHGAPGLDRRAVSSGRPRCWPTPPAPPGRGSRAAPGSSSGWATTRFPCAVSLALLDYDGASEAGRRPPSRRCFHEPAGTPVTLAAAGRRAVDQPGCTLRGDLLDVELDVPSSTRSGGDRLDSARSRRRVPGRALDPLVVVFSSTERQRPKDVGQTYAGSAIGARLRLAPATESWSDDLGDPHLEIVQAGREGPA